MQRKGFTLIELLAVIVVLAIIALIATPMVLNTIEKSKQGAASSSAYTYVSEVETKLATYMLKNGGVSYHSGKHTVSELQDDLKVEVKGDTPSVGNICIGENGTVTKASLKINNYVIRYDGREATTTDLEEIEDITCDGSVSNLGSICKPVNIKVTGQYSYGDEYLCDPGDGVERTFYLLEDGDNTTLVKGTTGTAGPGEVSLLMNQNIDDTAVAWISPEDYNNANTDGTVCEWSSCPDEGPITAMTYLLSKTTSWKNVSVFMPFVDQLNQLHSDSFDSWVCSNMENVSEYWLNGTWDLTGSDDEILTITSGCYTTYEPVSDDSIAGVRPVITISK